MPHQKRFPPLLLAILLTACIELPEVAEPEPPSDSGVPDAGTPDAGVPDAGPQPDGGAPADTTPPSITAASPAHGSTNVATTPQFLFTFSEPMNVGTVQVSIAPTVGLIAPAWAKGNTELTLQPVAPLAQNTTYTLAVEGKDVAGNSLTERRLFSFTTTGPAPDTTPPTVLSVTPAHGTIGVARDTSITVTFSEPMDKASAQTAFAITSPPGFNSGVFDWNTAGTQLTFNPDTDFPHGTEVIWRVSTTAKDLSSNPLENDATSTFRIIRINTVTFDFDRLTSGSAGSPNYERYSPNYNFETVGDTSQNRQSRLLIGFNLDPLPENLTRITVGKLKWFVSTQNNTPFDSLGKLLLERVYIGESIAYSSIESPNPAARTQYESSALDSPFIVPSSTISTVTLFDVTSFVVLDWSERIDRSAKRSQVRLRFETPSDNDGLDDRIVSDVDQTPKLAELEVTYEYP